MVAELIPLHWEVQEMAAWLPVHDEDHVRCEDIQQAAEEIQVQFRRLLYLAPRLPCDAIGLRTYLVSLNGVCIRPKEATQWSPLPRAA